MKIIFAIYKKERDFLRAAFYTLGCKVNQYETEVMISSFIREGFEIVEPKEMADVYVVNSCTVTSESDRKTRQLLRRFRRQNPSGVIALCGCFPQAFPDAAQRLGEADVILGASNKEGLLEAVKSRLAGGKKVVTIENYTEGHGFGRSEISSFGARKRAFVKIQDGCERFCAYCIIPYARGPVRSKPLDNLREEIEGLAAAGYKEVVLVGINLSCFGLERGENLTHAVKTVSCVEGIERIRLGSLEPEMLEPEIIAVLATESKLCPQFHLSLQSGSDNTLGRMNRHYNTSDYLKIVKNLEDSFPNTAITTDIMVGFPGETEEELLESLAFVKKVGFARTHVFAYSRREGTVADKMEAQIPPAEKSRRSKKMLKVSQEVREEFLKSQEGLVEEVLFENQNKEGLWEGYSRNYTSVLVKSHKDLARQIVMVKIGDNNGESCFGELV